MTPEFHARWMSRERAEWSKRKGLLGSAILLETFNGYIIVEPANGELGDGPILSREEAEYELTPVWYTGPKARLREARQRLGLDVEALASSRG